MKVDLRHVEKTVGMIRKKRLHGVALTVTFNEEEKAIIKERKIEDVCILERGYPADVSDKEIRKSESAGLVKTLAKVAVKGKDSLSHNLTYTKLLNGTDTYFLDTPLEAKEYEAVLREKLPLAKAIIMENAGIEQTSDSFEL